MLEKEPGVLAVGAGGTIYLEEFAVETLHGAEERGAFFYTDRT